MQRSPLPLEERTEMTTSLGLDIGTNSIGWCLYDNDTIKDIGVRIFGSSPQGAGRDPKSGASLAVDRRDARAMRRRRDRYLGRREALLRELTKRGLMPADKAAAKALEQDDPYVLRVKALDHPLSPYELGRALFHLNQRRGFKSNRKADRTSGEGEDGKIASGTKALDLAMADAGARTLGEFLLARDVKRVRMRPEADGYDFYPDRKHYEAEFAAIWDEQATHHPALLSVDARDAIHRIIFFQRPLKAQVVGHCTFAGWNGVPEDAPRIAKAHPLFQQRRLYEEVNQLRIVKAGAVDRALTKDERDTLILKLQDKKKVTFQSLAKIIKLDDGERLNKDSENRKDLAGDEVRAEMQSKKLFDTRWLHFNADEQWAIIDRLLNEEDTDALLIWLKTRYDLDEEAALAVANAKLPDGYGRFGEMATRALLTELTEDVTAITARARCMTNCLITAKCWRVILRRVKMIMPMRTSAVLARSPTPPCILA
jgi:CRISPR-associated endonuclease Csn1